MKLTTAVGQKNVCKWKLEQEQNCDRTYDDYILCGTGAKAINLVGVYACACVCAQAFPCSLRCARALSSSTRRVDSSSSIWHELGGIAAHKDKYNILLWFYFFISSWCVCAAKEYVYVTLITLQCCVWKLFSVIGMCALDIFFSEVFLRSSLFFRSQLSSSVPVFIV